MAHPMLKMMRRGDVQFTISPEMEIVHADNNKNGPAPANQTELDKLRNLNKTSEKEIAALKAEVENLTAENATLKQKLAAARPASAPNVDLSAQLDLERKKNSELQREKESLQGYCNQHLEDNSKLKQLLEQLRTSLITYRSDSDILQREVNRLQDALDKQKPALGAGRKPLQVPLPTTTPVTPVKPVTSGEDSTTGANPPPATSTPIGESSASNQTATTNDMSAERQIISGAQEVVNAAQDTLNNIKKGVRALKQEEPYKLYKYTEDYITNYSGKKTSKDTLRTHRFVDIEGKWHKMGGKYETPSGRYTKETTKAENLEAANETLRYVDGQWKIRDSSGSGPTGGPATKTDDEDGDPDGALVDKFEKDQAANTPTETKLQRTMREARAAIEKSRASRKKAEDELKKH